ncbi:MAG: diacylglycerol kinase family protein [bacterium]|nr:diacylglycerol kinase family protein [bacterium]
MDLRKLRHSFGYAMAGLYRLIRDEQNARIHVIITALTFIAAFVLKINHIEAAIVFMAVILVFGMEIINTAIEDLIDHLHPDEHATIARIKDAMSGAVFISAIIAGTVGVMIFYPYVSDAIQTLRS